MVLACTFHKEIEVDLLLSWTDQIKLLSTHHLASNKGSQGNNLSKLHCCL